MNPLAVKLRNLAPRSLQMMQKRHRLILGHGFKDGFKEIPNHGYAPKHAKAYADITTPPPRFHNVQEYNDNLFRGLLCVWTILMTYVVIIKPVKEGISFIKGHRPLTEADDRYAEYLEKYYYDEINKIMDDEAIIAASAQ